MTMNNRSAQSQSGNAMLEFAVLLPVTMILFFGTMDFSRVFYAAIELSNAAHAGALYGAQSVTSVADTAGIQRAAAFEAQDLSGMTAASSYRCQCPGGATVSCTLGTCTGYGVPEVYVSVTTAYTFQTLFGYAALPNSVAMTRTVVTRAQ